MPEVVTRNSSVFCSMQHGWENRFSLVLLFLTSVTEASLDLKEYPPAALEAGACFTENQVCALKAAWYDGGTDGSTGYRATFSSQDGRWHYSPKHVFDKETAGYPAQWQEGSYRCNPDTNEDCEFKFIDPLDLSPHTRELASSTEYYPGEWVRLDLPSAIAFTSMKIWAAPDTDSACGAANCAAGGGRPLSYRVYASADAGSTWTNLIEVTAQAYAYTGLVTNTNDVVDLTNSAAYDAYLLVVNKLTPTSTTLKLYELRFYSANGYCDSSKSADTNPNPTNCDACGSGLYSVSLNALSCTGKCPAGTYLKTSATGPTTCATCTAGKWAPEGAALCTDCGAGFFSTVIGAKNSEVCSPCPLGSWNPLDANNNLITAVTSCVLCAAGKARGPTDTGCTACTNKMSPAGSATCYDSCPAGTYYLGSGLDCLQCAAGKYKESDVDATSIPWDSVCLECDDGTFSGAGATVCIACPVGGYATGGDPYCTKCAAGKFGKVGGLRTDSTSGCTACPVGKSSLPGSPLETNCIICPKGKFASAEGSPLCADCPAGTYAGDHTYIYTHAIPRITKAVVVFSQQ